MEVSINNLNFTSRNINVRKIDQISRNVHNTFPVRSATRLAKFKTARRTYQNCCFIRRVDVKIHDLRSYYLSGGIKNSVMALFAGMKKTQVGNCLEQSIATTSALQSNGYKNAVTCALYAYNPKTKTIRDLDHAVSVVNLNTKNSSKIFSKKPDWYPYIKPDNDTIISDTWAGFTDYAKASTAKYKTSVPLSVPLLKSEEIMLLPSEYHINTDKITQRKIAGKYPSLILKENMPNKISRLFYRFKKNDADRVDEFIRQDSRFLWF